jgi:hypothetical protein
LINRVAISDAARAVLRGALQLPKVISGVTFTDGIEAGHENAAA